MEEAIKRINEEMQKTPDNLYIEIIGHYVIDNIKDDETAESTKDKTLAKAMENIKSYAKKKVQDGCAVVKDKEIFDVIDKYFGFHSTDKIRAECVSSVDGVKKVSQDLLDINFDDLL